MTINVFEISVPEGEDAELAPYIPISPLEP